MRGDESIEARIAKARRGSSAQAPDTQLQRIVGQHVDRVLAPLLRDFRTLKEKVEVLAGERGRREEYAVRRGDLARLGDMEKLASKPLAAAVPTQAEIDAIVRDVHRMHQRLSAIGDSLKE